MSKAKKFENCWKANLYRMLTKARMLMQYYSLYVLINYTYSVMERTERMSAAVQRPGPQTVVHSPIVEKSRVIRCTVRRIWLFIMQATSMQRQTTELKPTRRCTLRCSASDSCCLFACSFYQSSNSKCEYSVHGGDGDSCCHAKNEPSHFYASCSLVVYTTLF